MMKPPFFAFLFERPNAKQPWSPLAHPGLFQVGYRSGTFPRIQQCANVDDPAEEMKEWAHQAQALGLTPFLVMLNSGSAFAQAWRDDRYLGGLLLGSVEVDLILLEDILIYPEDEWLTRHLALCGKQMAKRLAADELPPLNLLIPYSQAYREWRQALDQEDEEDAAWRQADPSGVQTTSDDWLPVREGGLAYLINALCPTAYMTIARAGNTATLTAGGILTRLPTIRGLIPEHTNGSETVIDAQALAPWFRDESQPERNAWVPAWLGAWLARLSAPGLGYQLAGLAIIVAQAGFIAHMLAERPGTDYSEIRSPVGETRATGPFIRASFDPETKESDIRLLLVSLGATIVSGPSQLGDYILSVEPGRVEAVAEQLRQNPHVQAATVIASAPPAKE